jgi:hypothetical protein
VAAGTPAAWVANDELYDDNGAFRRQLDRLVKVLRMAVDGFWADSRHDVLTPGSGAVP